MMSAQAKVLGGCWIEANAEADVAEVKVGSEEN